MNKNTHIKELEAIFDDAMQGVRVAYAPTSNLPDKEARRNACERYANVSAMLQSAYLAEAARRECYEAMDVKIEQIRENTAKWLEIMERHMEQSQVALSFAQGDATLVREATAGEENK